MSTTESLTFANFQTSVHNVYDIGMDNNNAAGVLHEIAEVFEHDLTPEPDVDNLGELIGKVGPAKTLQDNIHRVRSRLGTDADAIDVARDWVERSGLLVPVERSFMDPDAPTEVSEIVMVTGGVRNWMVRRAAVAQGVESTSGVWVVGGDRVMRTTEGGDVTEGMTEADYLEEVVAPQFKNAQSKRAESSKGDEVMAFAADVLALQGIRKVTVASNAGAWVQNAGQLRRALRDVYGPGYDADGTEFAVKSDAFPLGTGVEPTATHQNPLTALGALVRNVQELARHQ